MRRGRFDVLPDLRDDRRRVGAGVIDRWWPRVTDDREVQVADEARSRVGGRVLRPLLAIARTTVLLRTAARGAARDEEHQPDRAHEARTVMKPRAVVEENRCGQMFAVPKLHRGRCPHPQLVGDVVHTRNLYKLRVWTTSLESCGCGQ